MHTILACYLLDLRLHRAANGYQLGVGVFRNLRNVSLLADGTAVDDSEPDTHVAGFRE